MIFISPRRKSCLRITNGVRGTFCFHSTATGKEPEFCQQEHVPVVTKSRCKQHQEIYNSRASQLKTSKREGQKAQVGKAICLQDLISSPTPISFPFTDYSSKAWHCKASSALKKTCWKVVFPGWLHSSKITMTKMAGIQHKKPKWFTTESSKITAINWRRNVKRNLGVLMGEISAQHMPSCTPSPAAASCSGWMRTVHLFKEQSEHWQW